MKPKDADLALLAGSFWPEHGRPDASCPHRASVYGFGWEPQNAGKDRMTTTAQLFRKRRFLPLFATQLLGAFNDNLYKNAMILYVVYTVYNSEAAEARFSAIASGVFILPFFLLSRPARHRSPTWFRSPVCRVRPHIDWL